MTYEQEVVQTIKAAIAGLPAEDQVQISRVAGIIRTAVELNADYGRCALALVGAEHAAREDQCE